MSQPTHIAHSLNQAELEHLLKYCADRCNIFEEMAGQSAKENPNKNADRVLFEVWYITGQQIMNAYMALPGKRDAQGNAI
jgi:site-specific recombinase XerD